MLYDGAIRFLKLGIEAIKRKDYVEANNQLTKVQQIISEFQITLDRSIPISADLSRLYDYFYRRLIEANISKQVEPAEEVLGYLQELKETWVQAAMQLKQGTASGQLAASVRHG
jgi:flagellar protein FliS